MKDQIIMLLIGILIALGGWNLTQTFSLSTTQAVLDDKVDKLERMTDRLRDQMDDMRDMDEDIMEQHEDLFEQIRNQDNDSGSGYNYG
jgi:predicted  nucleic acid-binding Zn-ribbon protein